MDTHEQAWLQYGLPRRMACEVSLLQVFMFLPASSQLLCHAGTAMILIVTTEASLMNIASIAAE